MSSFILHVTAIQLEHAQRKFFVIVGFFAIALPSSRGPGPAQGVRPCRCCCTQPLNVWRSWRLSDSGNAPNQSWFAYSRGLARAARQAVHSWFARRAYVLQGGATVRGYCPASGGTATSRFALPPNFETPLLMKLQCTCPDVKQPLPSPTVASRLRLLAGLLGMRARAGTDSVRCRTPAGVSRCLKLFRRSLSLLRQTTVNICQFTSCCPRDPWIMFYLDRLRCFVIRAVL